MRWLLRIDRISVPLGCGDDAKLAVALARLEGAAYNYSESSVYATWSDFKTALTLRYAEDKHIIKQKLAKCKQSAGENVSDYVDRHRMLCIRAGLSDRDGEEVLNKFLQGLIPTLYDRVMVSCPATYDEAVDKAVYFSKQLGKTGRGHLLQNDGEGTGSKPAPRAPFIPFNPPNRSSGPRYDSRGPHQGSNVNRQMPPSRAEAPGISDLTQDFGNKLKLNMRSTHYDPSYHQHPFTVHRPPPHNVMTRAPSCPSASLSMWESDSSGEGSQSDEDTYSYRPYADHAFPPSAAQASGDGNNTGNGSGSGGPSAPKAPAAPPSREYNRPGTPMPAVGMRRAIEHPPPPRVYERMEIDSMPFVPKPHVRKPFPVPAMHDAPPSHVPLDNAPPGGPRIIRRSPTGRPTVSFEPHPSARPAYPPPSPHTTTTQSKLGRNEQRLLDELYSCIKVRNLGLEELTSLRIDIVLSALAGKIRDAATGDSRPTPHAVNLVDARPSVPRHVPRSVYYDVLQASMLVGGVETPVIVDTGSTTCAVSLEFCETLGMLSAIQATDVVYINADGVSCLAPGVLPGVLVECGGMSQRVDALVIPLANYNFLVGIDFLGPSQASIHFADQCLELCINQHTRGRVPVSYTTTKYRTPPAIHVRSTLNCVSPPLPAVVDHQIALRGTVLKACLTEDGLSANLFSTAMELNDIDDQTVLKDKLPGLFTAWQEEGKNPYIPVIAAILTDRASQNDIWPVMSPITSYSDDDDDDTSSCASPDSNPTPPDAADLAAERYEALADMAKPPGTGRREFRSNGKARAPSQVGCAPKLHRTNPPLRPHQLCTLQTIPPDSAVHRPYLLDCGAVVIGSHLQPDQQQALFNLVAANEDIFSRSSSDLGCITSIMHEVDTGDAKPIKLPPYRLSYHEKDIMRAELEKMLSAGIIEPCVSNWSAPVVLVPKKSGGTRFCIDYRALNKCTLNKDAYPMPHLEDVLATVSTSPYVSTMDATQSYFQLFVHPNSRDKTAFSADGALYRFVRMPMGLTGAVATMQRFMTTTLDTLMHRCACIWVDDVILYSPTFEQHCIDLAEAFALIKDAGLKMSMKKSSFCPDVLRVLGHQITEGHLGPDDTKTECIRLFPVPTTVKQVRSWLGLCTWYKRFIRSFSAIAEPLTYLLRKDKPFIWGEAQQTAFDTLKRHLISEPILRMPQEDLPFILYTDWSSVAIGAILAQIDPTTKLEHVVAYGSRRLNPHERNYSPTEGEALSVVHFIKYWRSYLYGPRPFLVVTDHSALVPMLGELSRAKDLDGRLARWQLKLQQYNFTVQYRPGRLHSNVDALTRQDTDCPAAPPPKQINCLLTLNKMCPPLSTQAATGSGDAEPEVAELRAHQLEQRLAAQEDTAEQVFQRMTEDTAGHPPSEPISPVTPPIKPAVALGRAIADPDLMMVSSRDNGSSASACSTVNNKLPPSPLRIQIPSLTDELFPPIPVQQDMEPVKLIYDVRTAQQAAQLAAQQVNRRIAQRVADGFQATFAAIGTGPLADQNSDVSPATRQATRPASLQKLLEHVTVRDPNGFLPIVLEFATNVYGDDDAYKAAETPYLRNSVHPATLVLAGNLISLQSYYADSVQATETVRAFLSYNYQVPPDSIVGIFPASAEYNTGDGHNFVIRFRHPDDSAIFLYRVRSVPAIRSPLYFFWHVTFHYMPDPPSDARQRLEYTLQELVRLAPFTDPIASYGSRLLVNLFGGPPLIITERCIEDAFTVYQQRASLAMFPAPLEEVITSPTFSIGSASLSPSASYESSYASSTSLSHYSSSYASSASPSSFASIPSFESPSSPSAPLTSDSITSSEASLVSADSDPDPIFDTVLRMLNDDQLGLVLAHGIFPEEFAGYQQMLPDIAAIRRAPSDPADAPAAPPRMIRSPSSWALQGMDQQPEETPLEAPVLMKQEPAAAVPVDPPVTLAPVTVKSEETTPALNAVLASELTGILPSADGYPPLTCKFSCSPFAAFAQGEHGSASNINRNATESVESSYELACEHCGTPTSSAHTPVDDGALLTTESDDQSSPLDGPTPIIISVEGLIGCGKSTALTLAAQELQLCGFSVQLEPLVEFEPEAISLFYNDPHAHSMTIQTAALRSFGRVPLTPLLIVERSPEACTHVFSQGLHDQGLISSDQLADLASQREDISWSPHAFIHVDTPTPICMQRIRQRSRGGEEHIPESLLTLHDRLYDNMYHDLNKPVFYIDGTHDPEYVAAKLIYFARHIAARITNNRRSQPDQPFIGAATCHAVMMKQAFKPRVVPEDGQACGSGTTTVPPSKKQKMPPPQQSLKRERTEDAAGPSEVNQNGNVPDRKRYRRSDLHPPRTDMQVDDDPPDVAITRIVSPPQMTIPKYFHPAPTPSRISLPPDDRPGPSRPPVPRPNLPQSREYMPRSDDNESFSDDITELISEPELGASSDDRPIPLLATDAEIETVYCRTCHLSDPEDTLLLCDMCNGAYHTTCLTPALRAVPSGAWICDKCSSNTVGNSVLDVVDDTHLLQFLRDGQLPSKESVDPAEWRTLVKRVRKRATDYLLINSVLFRQISKTYPKPRRVPPVAERPALIRSVHDQVGHWGVGKTLYLAAKNWFWAGMSNDVKNYVAACDACQHEKASFKLRTTLHPLPIARLFERVSLDLVGPLVTTRKGNQHLVVAIDGYSKYVIAAPIPNKLASTVADFFLQQVICRISCPVTVRTDHGSEFKWQFSDLMTKYGISHQMSSPHNPQSNGQVERSNQSIIHSIRRSMHEHLNNWDDYVHTSVYGYNISKQASTGFSPHYMLYNQDARIGDSKDATAMQNAALVTEMEQARNRDNHATTTAAIANMGVAQTQQKRDYDRRRPMDQQLYDTGTMVLIKNHTKGDKLNMKVEGPYRLDAYSTDHTRVQVSDATGRHWTEHATFIVPYKEGAHAALPPCKPPTTAARSPPPTLPPASARRPAPASRPQPVGCPRGAMQDPAPAKHPQRQRQPNSKFQ